MTKDKKPTQKTSAVVAPANSQKLQSDVSSTPSVRLLTKIEIKDSSIPHNLLIPAPMSHTVRAFLSSMESKFKSEYKFHQLFIESQNGQYRVENQYTIGQCFKDFDNVLIKGSKVSSTSP